MTVKNLDDHVPGLRDSDGHLRCDACAFRWPCPDVRASGASLTPNDEALLELVEPGWQVWTRQSSPDVAPVGGLVLGWKDEVAGGGADHDADVSETRVYTVLYWKNGKPQFRRLAASELDPELCQLPNLTNIRTQWRSLCREVGAARSTNDDEEIRLLETAFTLTRFGTKGHAA